MKTLFLDLSTRSTGWAVGEDRQLIDYGCIASSSSDLLKRISIMVNFILEVIDKHNITHIVAEEVHPDIPNSHTYKVLIWLQGIVIFEVCKQNPKITYEFIQANSWRSKIGIHTGRGIKRETLKKADVDYVKNKYNIIANDDICDAICLLDAYYVKEAAAPTSGFDWS